MSMSKATAVLMRLKAIDKKYKARYKDEKPEHQSSDNTESLLEEAKYKNDAPSMLTKGKEILKPTLNIKIPDTCIEQLESNSTSSDQVSPSLRVSIVDKSPIATPKVQSESESEIQEELDDAESIVEALEDSNYSDSEATKQSHDRGLEKGKTENSSLPITAKNLSAERKKATKHESPVEDVRLKSYSHDSFETYSSIAENSSFSDSGKKESKSKHSSSKSYEGSVLVSNTENTHILPKSKRTADLELAASTEKENKVKTSKVAENTDESDEIGEELSTSLEAVDSALDSKATFKDTKISVAYNEIEDAETPHAELSLSRLKQKNDRKNRDKSSSTINDNSSDKKSHVDQSDRTDLAFPCEENQEESLSTSKATDKSVDKSGGSRIKHSVSEFSYELRNKHKSSSVKTENSLRVDSGKKRRKHKELKDTKREKSVVSANSSPNESNSSSVKSGRERSKSENSKVAETGNSESLISSAKEANSPLESCDDDKIALSISERSRKETSTQLLLQRRRKDSRKSGEYPTDVGRLPESDLVETESSSRGISSRERTEHHTVASEKILSTNVNGTLRSSKSVIEIETTKRRNNPAIISRKSHYQNSKSYKHIHSNNGAAISKSSVLYRLKENKYPERKDRELERLKMRMTNLRLEQERQLLLQYIMRFEEDRERLILWPDRLYCPGETEESVIKPLNFPNILNFTKPASTPADRARILPDNNLTMLKDRVVEIRQWLKDQYILYRDYSDVAATINAKYSAAAKAHKVGSFFNYSHHFLHTHFFPRSRLEKMSEGAVFGFLTTALSTFEILASNFVHKSLYTTCWNFVWSFQDFFSRSPVAFTL